jgi:hypothetical protein
MNRLGVSLFLTYFLLVFMVACSSSPPTPLAPLTSTATQLATTPVNTSLPTPKTSTSNPTPTPTQTGSPTSNPVPSPTLQPTFQTSVLPSPSPVATTFSSFPSITLYPSVNSGLKVSINGVTLPGASNLKITKIGWDWGDGSSEEHWFPTTHTYSAAGDYTVKVTSYQSDGQKTEKSTPVHVQP